ncbi:MAG: rhodanese-like domain-containing protein [Candidatus Kapabacteria bacterium]|nr:rhodanese-like domain-containing protein [Candidatus Kapabacteria bacterium]
MKTIIAVIVVGLLAISVVDAGSSGDVSTASAEKMVKDTKGLIILDVRTPEEYAAGHLANAKLMNYYDKNFTDQLKTLPKSKSVLIYCKSGRRSAETLALMKKLGYKKAYNMLGGFVAWSNEKRPSTTK